MSEEQEQNFAQENQTKNYSDIIESQKSEIDHLFEEHEAREALANKKDKNHEEAVLNHKNSIDSLFEEMALENED